MILSRNFSKNHLDGRLPSEFGNLRSVQIMYVTLFFNTKYVFPFDFNRFMIMILCSDMSFNNLSGTIPAELGQLQNIFSL